MLQCVLGLALILLGTACNSTKKHPATDLKESISADTFFLGKGFDTETFQSVEQCASGDERTEVQPVGTWSMKSVENWETVKRDLGFANEAEYAYQLIKGAPKAKFTRQLRDSELSATYVISADYVNATKFLNNVAIKPPLLTRATGTREERLDFRRHCGNHYTSQVDVGGKLRVMVKFRFNNKDSRAGFDFHSDLRQETPEANGVTIKVDHMRAMDKQASTVEVTFYQEGGDLSHLAEIGMGSGITCNLDDWSRCQKLIVELARYSIKTFSADVAGGAARVIEVKTRPYEDIELPGMSDAAALNRISTALEVERQDYDAIRVELLLRHRDNYSIEDRRRALETTNAMIQRNLIKLQANIQACIEFREDEKRCIDPKLLTLESYDPGRLMAGSAWILGPKLGNDRGELYSRVCNNLMNGASGYYGSVLDQLIVGCDDGLPMPPIGSQNARSNYKKSCPSGSVITGMRGGVGKNSIVSDLTFVCTPLESIRAGTKDGTGELRIFGGGPSFFWNCPPGYAAHGVMGHAGEFVDSMLLICANI